MSALQVPELSEPVGPAPGAGVSAGDEEPGDEDRTRVLVLCTGNAARSVMAGYMLRHLLESSDAVVDVVTAGTHAVAGQPVSARTRAALATVAPLREAPVARHRSRQLVPLDVERADLVVAMEADHVRYVRRQHPGAASRTATIRRLCRDLPAGASPLAARVAALGFGDVVLGSDEDVADPAGGDDVVYEACAAELWELCRTLAPRLFPS